MKKADWAIIGGGITGIVIGEILAREGYSVVLIEKNEKLAGETTRDFHEWIHTGSLYTLVPDNLKTLKFILGAIDDLLEYYSCFERMNLIPTSSGLKIDTQKNGWFLPNYIHFKYRIKDRKLTFPWLLGIARSVILLDKIHRHDWLRRRAGEVGPFKENKIKQIIKLAFAFIKNKGKFYSVKTPDFTTDSRVLLRDLVSTALENGMILSLGNEVKSIKDEDGLKIISGTKENICATNVAICAGDGIERFTQVKIKKSYAPIAVVSDVPESAKSFVELDYFPKNCINMITKPFGMGLVGGISFNNKSYCDTYMDYVIKEHKKQIPELKEIKRYIGVKSEITFANEPRSYLYHIVSTDKNIWAVIPGKFTLGFSLAPEFFRRIYNKNPRKTFQTTIAKPENDNLIAETVWFDNKIVK